MLLLSQQKNHTDLEFPQEFEETALVLHATNSLCYPLAFS